MFNGCKLHDRFDNPFAPVTDQEAVSFGKLLVEEVNQGNKEKIINAGIDPTAPHAVCEFLGEDFPNDLANPTPADIEFDRNYTIESHKALYEKTKHAEFVSVEPIGSTFQVVVRFDTITILKNDISDRENKFILGKTKKTGDIVILSRGLRQ